MIVLARILRELWGLFVDDGKLALWLVVWTVIAGFGLPPLIGDGWLASAALAAGYLGILIENVRRFARNGVNRSRSSGFRSRPETLRIANPQAKATTSAPDRKGE